MDHLIDTTLPASAIELDDDDGPPPLISAEDSYPLPPPYGPQTAGGFDDGWNEQPFSSKSTAVALYSELFVHSELNHFGRLKLCSAHLVQTLLPHPEDPLQEMPTSSTSPRMTTVTRTSTKPSNCRPMMLVELMITPRL